VCLTTSRLFTYYSSPLVIQIILYVNCQTVLIKTVCKLSLSWYVYVTYSMYHDRLTVYHDTYCMWTNSLSWYILYVNQQSNNCMWSNICHTNCMRTSSLLWSCTELYPSNQMTLFTKYNFLLCISMDTIILNFVYQNEPIMHQWYIAYRWWVQ